jgi:hypothetical protein
MWLLKLISFDTKGVTKDVEQKNRKTKKDDDI